MNISELKNIGWKIDEELLRKYLEEKHEEKVDNKHILNIIRDIDIKVYGKQVLLNILDRQKGSLQGPVVLQLVKFKNVSHSQSYDNYDPKNDYAKMTFTDGFNNVNGINFGILTKICSNTPPGAKVLFKENITFSDGLLLLSDENINVLGGDVEKLINRWKMDRLTFRGIGNLQKNDAPKWIPFSKTQQFKKTQEKNNGYIKTNNTLYRGDNSIKNEKAKIINKNSYINQKTKKNFFQKNESSSLKNKNISNDKVESFGNKAIEQKEFKKNNHTKDSNNASSRKGVNDRIDISKNDNKSNNFDGNNSKSMPFYTTRENNYKRGKRGNFSNIREGNRNFRGSSGL